MIGERFEKYLIPSPPRQLTRLQLFLTFIKLKIADNTARSNHLTPNGYGSRLLMDIVKLVDLDKVLSPGEPVQKSAAYIFSMVKDLEKMIDVRVGRHTTSHLFVKSKTPCFELMTPSRRKNPLVEIPIELPYTNPAWSSIKPLRVSDMGVCDLKLNFQTDYLQYANRGPTHVVYALDCFALVCKFIAYYKFRSPVVDREQALLDFVHDEVIVPAILNDTFAIWLRNVYKQQLISYSPLETHTATIWDNITTDTIGSDFSGAMQDIVQLKNDLINQSVTANVAMSSLLLTTDRRSFSTYYKDLYKTTTTPDQQPYVWVDCLKNLAWWEFIVLIASFLPGHPDTVSMQRDVTRDVHFWLAMKPWNEIKGSIPFKEMVRNRLEGLHTYLKTI